MVEPGRVMSALQLKDNARGRRGYGDYMERRALEAGRPKGKAVLEAEWEPIRRGWYLGSEEFGEKMQGLIDSALVGKSRSSFSGAAIHAHDAASATHHGESMMRLAAIIM